MNSMPLSPQIKEQLRQSQIAELTDSLLYDFMARREKDAANRDVLRQMANDERGHAATWRGYTGADLAPHRLWLLWSKLVVVLLGFTFMVKMRQKKELTATAAYL
jgi:vacuolar iron transporter family protein